MFSKRGIAVDSFNLFCVLIVDNSFRKYTGRLIRLSKLSVIPIGSSGISLTNSTCDIAFNMTSSSDESMVADSEIDFPSCLAGNDREELARLVGAAETNTADGMIETGHPSPLEPAVIIRPIVSGRSDVELGLDVASRRRQDYKGEAELDVPSESITQQN